MAEISARLRQEVADRAGRRCEYCLISEQHSFSLHQVDHIIARKHGGGTELHNLALCCTLCNRRKGSDLASLDPATGELVSLFHPRRHHWNEHFDLRGGEIVPLSAHARATVHLLRLNRPDRVSERDLLVRKGWLWIRENPE